jgi:hypothetical protein
MFNFTWSSQVAAILSSNVMVDPEVTPTFKEISS